jgi:hypothetical protein
MRERSRVILQNNCLHCHGSFVSAITNHVSEEQVNCIQCHRGVGHDPTR